MIKNQIMSEIWKTLGNDEREAYRSRARDDQKRYKAEQADKVSAFSCGLKSVLGGNLSARIDQGRRSGLKRQRTFCIVECPSLDA